MTALNEQERIDAMKACPILEHYLATALQDLQFSESDESCEEERDARDTGTIYDCPDETFRTAWQACAAFMADNAAHLAAIADDETENYYQAWRGQLSYGNVGYHFHMTRVGHGVGFWEHDSDNPAIAALDSYCKAHRGEGLYFGDDGKVYF